MNISFVVCLLVTTLFGVLHDGRDVEVYFGTGRNNAGFTEGVYQSNLRQDDTKLAKAALLFELKGAGWVTLHPDASKQILYSTGNVDGNASVVALSVEPSKSDSPLINSQAIDDGGSCFLTTDQTASMLISAQYGGGSIAVFPIEEDGSLGARSQLIEHEGGSGVVKNRQDSPHPHYVAISPDNRFAFVPDLGLDQLVVYKIDTDSKQLVPHGKVDVIAGGGPRHMKFHPDGKFAFVLNELTLSVSVFKYDVASGEMNLVETVPALTDKEKSLQDFNSASEIRVHPNGKMVFSANRGHDSISVYTFDEANSKLTRIQVAPIHGAFPRNFNLSPDGSMLLAAGQHSNSISLFQIHEKGKLEHLGNRSEFVPGPICVEFAR